MYTYNAQQTGLNMSNVASTGIDDLYDMVNNSGLNNSDAFFVNAGIQYLPGFTENTNDPEGDVNGILNLSAVQAFRASTRSDIIILLTDGNYSNGSVFGAAAEIEAGYSTAAAIVEADVANVQYTFTHEVVHLIGGRHQKFSHHPTNCQDGPGYEHGWLWFSGLFNACQHSTVTAGANANFPRKLQLSNPDIEGSATDGDNARMLKENISTVSGFEIDPMTVTISGPDAIPAYNTGCWSLNICNCTSGHTILWEYSFNGSNYSYGSTSNTYCRSLFSNQYMYLRATVTCSDGYAPVVAHKTVVLDNNWLKERPTNINVRGLSSDVDLNVFPNPVSSILFLSLGNRLKSENYKGQLFDVSGKLVTSFIIDQDDNTNFSLNVSNYNPGTYFIRVQGENEVYTKKIIISDEF